MMILITRLSKQLKAAFENVEQTLSCHSVIYFTVNAFLGLEMLSYGILNMTTQEYALLVKRIKIYCVSGRLAN